MSERGIIAIDRGIFTDEDFADEPFTEREAFMWLVAEAAWKTRRARGAKGSVQLDRGEVCHSVRFMAEAWSWSKSRVDRFMKRLVERDTIRDTSRDGEKVYSVKNYNKFQRIGLPERDSSGTETGQQRDKLETGNNTIPNGIEGEPSVVDFDPRTILFRQGKDWLARTAGLPDQQVRSLIGKWLKVTGDDAGKILESFRRCREARPIDVVSWLSASITPKRPRDLRDIKDPVERARYQSF